MNYNFWVFRIDKSRADFFNQEIHADRLRQGWGWDERQDLRNLTMDGGAKKNLPMFQKVKKGDIILIPQLPKWGEVTIVEASEDWNIGYRFEIAASQSSDWNKGDYGHIFPVKFLKSFSKINGNVSGNLRSTLRNPGRFWSINHYSSDVETILAKEVTELDQAQTHEARYQSVLNETFSEVFDENRFKDNIYQNFTNRFRDSEWEYALVQCFKQLFPFYEVKRVGGTSEVNHGTDILVKIPTILTDYNME